MQQLKLGFIGGGNMARSIIGGLNQYGHNHDISVCDPDTAKLDALNDEFAVRPCHSNEALLKQVDIVVLSVKPQLMQCVLKPLGKFYSQFKPLIMSIAAGVSSSQILNWLGDKTAPCIRVMPNTPALVQAGASGLFAVNANNDQKQTAERIMSAVGITVWLDDESLMDTVTAVSGSGPAYFFYLMEAIQKSAISNGLAEDIAKNFTLQTAIGAAKLAQLSEQDFESLRKQVSSPGGTTERAINILAENNFLSLVDQAVSGAALRSRELSEDC